MFAAQLTCVYRECLHLTDSLGRCCVASILRTSVVRRCAPFALSQTTRNHHALNNATTASTRFLQPHTADHVSSCGMKIRGNVHRRCKDCFLVYREGRLYNICYTHPRHKQMGFQKKKENTWILTDVMTTPRRPW